ncbi:hypothetical protein KC315_g47 [Hortaea werneckii]|nr:hypothetical protein KC315_g47 [Hortaea werneckii]
MRTIYAFAAHNRITARGATEKGCMVHELAYRKARLGGSFNISSSKWGIPVQRCLLINNTFTVKLMAMLAESRRYCHIMNSAPSSSAERMAIRIYVKINDLLSSTKLWYYKPLRPRTIVYTIVVHVETVDNQGCHLRSSSLGALAYDVIRQKFEASNLGRCRRSSEDSKRGEGPRTQDRQA